MGAGQQLFFTPQEYFEGLIADIDNAQTTIVLEVYIFELGIVGNRLLEALERAAARRVKLQVLIDGVGSYRDGNAIATRLDTPECALRVFHPLPWDFGLYRRALGSGRGLSRLLHSFAS
ncbi:MAG: phospholipase D-like domain-containing protein, partial [Gammaproteobacteria bacterium]